MDLLIALMRNPGQVVSKKELMAQAWPHSVVDDAAIRVQMSGLRRVLGDGKNGRRYIINVTQRGYQFIAPVMQLPVATEDAPCTYPAQPDWGTLAPLGRCDDCATLYPLLFTTRCLTLTGGAGVGKSLVAKALARARRSYASSPPCIVLHYDAISEVAGTTTLLYELLSSRDAQHDDNLALLVIDNCEHRINEVAQHAARLLTKNSQLRILVTSREPMRIDGEIVRRVYPLGAEAAAALFVQRCRAGAEDAVLGPIHAEVVADICQRLDGNPLALEMAALRAAELGLGAVAQLMVEPLSFLTRGRRTAPQRHQSMRSALDWSYALLSEAERQVLRQLALLSGDFTLMDARNICGGNVIDELGGLLACSLMYAHSRQNGPTYSVPPLVRHFVIEQSDMKSLPRDFSKLCNA